MLLRVSIYFVPISVYPNSPRADVDILNFALTLEHLENAYYQQGLSKYSEQDFLDAGLPQWARGRFQQVAAHEKTHVEFLTTAINAAGAHPVEPCEYQL